VRTLVVDALRIAGERTGQGRHVEYLAHEWSRMDVPFDRILFMAPRAVTLDGLGSRTEVAFVHFAERLPTLFWEQAALPVRAREAAVLFCPTYFSPLLHGGRVVLANHGIYERLPDEFPLRQRLRSTPLHRLSARRANRVIANSQQTKRDMIELFRVPADKVDVVYPAANEVFFADHANGEIAAEVERVLGHPGPYVIFVGKLSKRRHIPNLIEAFSRVRRDESLPHRLLIVGPNTTGLDVDAIARAHEVGEAVTYLPYLDQQPLSLLYAGADAFVLPTTYEGISQTMFEAMASGTAVLTVDHPTLSEGAGDTALAVRTPSVQDLVDGLRTILGDETLRQSLAARGRERAREFSWTRVARETMVILDAVAASTDRGRSRR
jgi:glycosyltransferase involved in cell wall biosynthesis